MNKLYKKLKEKWLQLSKKRKFFYLSCFFVLFLVIIIPFAANASVWTAVASILGAVMKVLIDLLGKIVSLMLNILISLFQFNNFLGVTAVREGWRLVRDVCNMFFIIILLIISFATILKIESYAYKKWLVKLVIAAILINFSKTITGFLIGISQVVMLTFVSAFKNAVVGNIASGLHLDKFLNIDPTAKVDVSAGTILLTFLLAFILILVFAIVLIIMAVILVGRIVSLWVLVILSPIAYLFQASPFGSKYANQWWQMLGKNLVSGPVLAFFLWLALLTIQRSSEGVAVDMYKNNEAALVTGSSDFSSDIGKPTYVFDYIVTIALLMAAIKLTQEMGVIGSSFAGKMQQGMSKFAQKALKSSTVGLAGYLDRKQATLTKVQFAKIPGNIKEGLKLRKEEEERKIRGEAGKAADAGKGPLAVLQGLTAGPEAAKKMWFTGFLGLKGIAKTAKVVFGPKGTYRKEMDKGVDNQAKIEENKETAKEIRLFLNFTEKANKVDKLNTDIINIDGKLKENKEKQKTADGDDLKKLEDEEKDLKTEKGGKESEISNIFKHAMVIYGDGKDDEGVRNKIADDDDAVAKNITRIRGNYKPQIKAVEDDDSLSDEDKKIKIKKLLKERRTETKKQFIVRNIRKKEKKDLDKSYNSQIDRVEEDQTLSPEVREAKIKQLKAEQTLKNIEIDSKYYLSKDDQDEEQIETAQEVLKSADDNLLDVKKEKGIIKNKDYKKQKKAINKDFENGKGRYEIGLQGENYGEFVVGMGEDLLKSVEFAEDRGEIDWEEADKQINNIEKEHGLNGQESEIVEKSEDEISDSKRKVREGKVKKDHKREQDKIDLSKTNIENNKQNIVENLDNMKAADIKKQAQDLGISLEGESLNEIGASIAAAIAGIPAKRTAAGPEKSKLDEVTKEKSNLQNLEKMVTGIEVDGNSSIEDIIKNIGAASKTSSKDGKEDLKKEKEKAKKLEIREEENIKREKNLERVKEKEINQAQIEDVAKLNLKGLNEAGQLLKNSLEGLAKKIGKISMPKSLSARIAERSLVEEKKKEFMGMDDAAELTAYLKSAVDNKEIYKVRALLEKMAADANDNEFLNSYGYSSNAVGMEQFRQEILKGKLKMGEQGSLQVLNDVGYINEKVGHWETARLVTTDATGKMKSKVEQKSDGSWDDTLHAIEAFTEISKMNGRNILNNMNRLAYGGERPHADGSRSFEFSNLGKMILTMLGGDRELLAKRGSELNINAAQNFMTPGAKEQIAVLLGTNSDMFHTIRKVSGEVQGIRSDYQSVLDSLRARGQWGTYKNQ